MGAQGHQCECHRAGLCRDKQHDCTAGRCGTQCGYTQTHTCRTMGKGGRHGRRRRLSGVIGIGLCAWHHLARRWRLAGALGNSMKTFYSLPEDIIWTEVAPGNRRAVLAERPEMMLVAFSFEPGTIGA